MNNIIYKTNKSDWYEASLAKKELAFHRSRNSNGRFDSAIKKEQNLIRSFREQSSLTQTSKQEVA